MVRALMIADEEAPELHRQASRTLVPDLVLSAGDLPCESPRPHGAVNADGLVVEAAGLRIAGLGGCVRYRPGPHQYTQREYDGRAHRLVRRARRAAARSTSS